MAVDRAAVAREGGFTLVEMLVAMAAGVVVVFGATALMISALKTTQRVDSRVQSTQQAQTAMERVMQQLDSGCLASDVSPVLALTPAGISPSASSDASHVVFVSGVGNSASVNPTLHVLTATSGGGLVDTSYAWTGSGSGPALNVPSTWTFNTTPTRSVTLIEHLAQVGGVPFFRYYSYSSPSNPTANSLTNAAALAVPLTTGVAPTVAQVTMTWAAAPSGYSGQAADTSGSTSMTDSAVFRLTPADPDTTNYPCD